MLAAGAGGLEAVNAFIVRGVDINEIELFGRTKMGMKRSQRCCCSVARVLTLERPRENITLESSRKWSHTYGSTTT